ncbi:MAG: aspartate aminotransferase family protein [Thaumarchaeota archaeon]|nr:aspartate aminotransferase family protein [Nitrososphaerota archaeon]
MRASHIDERGIVARFEAKTRKSAELYRRALEVTPGGVMAGIKHFEPYPLFMKKADGSHLWDLDGNEYVDYLLSYGAIILGHGNRVVKESVESVLDTYGTTVMGTPTELESDYGVVLRDMYRPDGMIRFTNSGLEATLLAVRLAKGHTGRRKVAKFEGHYHGAVDHFLFSYTPDVEKAGSQESPTPVGDSVDVDGGLLSESVALPFNNWKATERIIEANSKELACVMMEPFEEGVIPGDHEFMRNLRSLTSDHGIPLVFDEVKTGFRVRPGGASEYYSVTPDLTCLGKIIGGGLPIGAVVGEAEMMKQLDPRKGNRRKVFHSGTFNGNPLSLSVGMATVRELTRKGRFEGLLRKTESLKQMVAGELTSHSLPHDIEGEGAMFNIYLTDKKVRNYRDAKASDLRLRRLIDMGLLASGVYLKPENRYCLSLAHSNDDIRQTGEKFGGALDALAS